MRLALTFLILLLTGCEQRSWTEAEIRDIATDTQTVDVGALESRLDEIDSKLSDLETETSSNDSEIDSVRSEAESVRAELSSHESTGHY